MRRLWVLALFLLLGGCGGKKAAALESPDSLDEPDRVLFERGMRELERNRYNVARLTLQTLINTYPDSEYLPQAKYAMAESFYREGTTSALVQAESEFKDYITFFPTSDMADDAQLMVAMTHIRQMEKPDRDRTQALMAELELKNMIQNYPDSPLLDDSKEKLRAVQEILAEGVYKIGNFYYIKKSYPAAVGRYKEVLDKYPDFSKLDDTLFQLAESLRRNNNEPESIIYYGRIVSDHPLSGRVEDAKNRLLTLNAAIPAVNAAALARAQQNRPESKGLFAKMLGMFSRRPDVSTESNAASVTDDGREQGEKEKTETKDGAFGIEGTVVSPTQKPPVKKP